MNGSSANWTPGSSVASTTTLNPYVMVYYLIWDWLVVAFVFPLWPVALYFNITTVLVFVKSSVGTNKTTRLYYTAIAAGDIVVLISRDFFFAIVGFGVYFVGLDKLFPGGIYRWPVENRYSCATVAFFWFVGDIFVNFTYVVLDVERFIALYFPFKVKSALSKRKLVAILAAVALYALGITSNMYFTRDVVANAYVVRGLGCSQSVGNSYFVLATSITILCSAYVIPTLTAALFTALVAVKIRSIILNRRKFHANSGAATSDKPTMTAKQIDSFLTPLVLSAFHTLCYVPLAVFRLSSYIVPYIVSLSSTQNNIIYALGYIFFQLAMPVHIFNFLVYVKRIPGFWQNAKLVTCCRYSQLVKRPDSSGADAL